MEIAIVEDLESDYNVLASILSDELKIQRVDFHFHWFQRSETLLSNFSSEQYDLMFFDILLGAGINGMELARIIRETGCHTPIVFTTGERDYALDGYEVQALDYLLKPYQPDRIREVLKRVLNALRTQRYIIVQNEQVQLKFCTDELLWAEARNHYMEIHLLHAESIRTYLSFEAFVERLPPMIQFQCCCRGIIVNLEYVNRFCDSELLLRDGQRVPVSRRKKDEIKKLLIDYAIAKTREEMDI